MTRYFITGTDTDAGKTVASCALLHAWRRAGLQPLASKPIASGCAWLDGRLIADDAQRLALAEGRDRDPATLVQLAFEPPIAPHIAASETHTRVDLAAMVQAISQDEERHLTPRDPSLIEGVGGWCVPLDEQQLLPALPRALDAKVVLVVGLTLGCLNHALLTADRISADGFELVGWIGNRVDVDFARPDANIASLQARISAPLLGLLPHNNDPYAPSMSQALDLALLR